MLSVSSMLWIILSTSLAEGSLCLRTLQSLDPHTVLKVEMK